jgi:hypothetical protein
LTASQGSVSAKLHIPNPATNTPSRSYSEYNLLSLTRLRGFDPEKSGFGPDAV